METLADRLKKALAIRGMTVADLMAATKLSKAAVYFILDGTTTSEGIRETTISKLCRALSVSRDWLTKGRGSIDGTTDDVDAELLQVKLALSCLVAAMAAHRPAEGGDAAEAIRALPECTPGSTLDGLAEALEGVAVRRSR